MTNLDSATTAKTLTMQIKAQDPSGLVVLAGNKCDAPDSEQVVKVGKEDRDLAKNLGVNQHFKISAKEGNGVAEMFEKVVKLIMDRGDIEKN